MIEAGLDNFEDYRRHLVVAAELNRTSASELRVNAMCSNGAIHGFPISLNLMFNAVLKAVTDDSYSIKTANAPLANQMSSTLKGQISEATTIMLWVLLFPLGEWIIIYFTF